MKLANLLKETGVKSNIGPWAEECEKFQDWFTKLGGNVSNNVSMAKAYLKIQPKQPQEDSLAKILNGQS